MKKPWVWRQLCGSFPCNCLSTPTEGNAHTRRNCAILSYPMLSSSYITRASCLKPTDKWLSFDCSNVRIKPEFRIVFYTTSRFQDHQSFQFPACHTQLLLTLGPVRGFSPSQTYFSFPHKNELWTCCCDHCFLRCWNNCEFSMLSCLFSQFTSNAIWYRWIFLFAFHSIIYFNTGEHFELLNFVILRMSYDILLLLFVVAFTLKNKGVIACTIFDKSEWLFLGNCQVKSTSSPVFCFNKSI